MPLFTFDKIIPLGERVVMHDVLLTVLLKRGDALFVCLVLSPVDRSEYSQPCFCPDSRSHLLCLLHRMEDSSFPSLGDLREESVLNRIPFGTIRWIMGNPDVNANVIRQTDKAMLEEPSSSRVGSASVAKYEYCLRMRIDCPKDSLPVCLDTVTGKLSCIMAYAKRHIASILDDIIYAIRNYLPFCERLEVMVKGVHYSLRVCTPIAPSEVAHNFLLLCVNADYWLASGNLLLTQLLYSCELCIPVLALGHGYGFQWLSSGIAFGSYHLPHRKEADIYVVILLVSTLYLQGAEPKPFRVSVLWKACIAVLYNLRKVLPVFRVFGKNALPAAARFAYPAFFDVYLFFEFVHSSVYGLPVYMDSLAHKTHAMLPISLGNNSKELSTLVLVQIFEEFLLVFSNNVCWGIRTGHNYLEISCKGTNISADLKI